MAGGIAAVLQVALLSLPSKHSGRAGGATQPGGAPDHLLSPTITHFLVSRSRHFQQHMTVVHSSSIILQHAILVWSGNSKALQSQG